MIDVAARCELAGLWLFLLLGYGGLLAAVVRLAARSNAGYWVSGGFACALTVVAACASGLSPSAYGLTLAGGLASLVRAVVATAVLVGAAAPLWLVLRRRVRPDPTPRRVDRQLVAYVLLSAPLQEVVFRGVFQGSARAVFGGDGAAHIFAVAFSTVAFALAHLPWGASVALLMLVPGLVWGVQVERDGTLLGAAVSHCLVGYLFVGAVPLWTALGDVSPSRGAA